MDDWSGRKWEPVTEERLLRAIDVLVEIAKEHGPAFDPVLETVRQELHQFRNRTAPVADGVDDGLLRKAS
ncbi:hypothetical protein [Microvirga mediterraneensis]|uniref:Uncharacterized protein n=1 Tax=Microvirga mediterraneensis TaxID=2754695 RepID=A0A838BGQ4_9HYPH|nr:hypothetical protein [Microvirga mediterraneensis]MBA1154750.1 hypothetical protein [Microvirga mediterraneensis]